MALECYMAALESGEDFMLGRLFAYASEAEYTRYTSTKEDEWRMTVREPARALAEYMKEHDGPDPIHVDEKFEDSAAAAFGVLEARRHRARGVRFEMFMGLTKLVRQAFVDLLYATEMPEEETRLALAVTHRFFDKFELGFCGEWVSRPESAVLADLQDANRRLANEKNRCLTIFNSVSDPVFVVDTDMRIVEANKRFEEVLGVVDVAQGHRKCSDVMACSCCQACPLPRAIAQSDSFSGHEVRLDVNGQSRTMLFSGSSLDDISGKNAGGVAVLQDITERKEAEGHLRESEQRYRALFDNSLELIYIHDLEGRFLDANDRALSLLGYDRDDIKELGFPDLLDEGDIARAVESARQIARDGSADRIQEYRLRARDGSHVWVETSGVRLDKDGTTYAVLGFARDISDRKRSDRALRRSEEWYKALIQSSSVAYDVVDVEGNVLYASPSVERMFGWTPEEVQAQTIFALVHPDDVSLAVKEFTELARNPGTVRTVEVRYRHKDGTWRDLHVSGVNMVHDPLVGGIILTSHDITDQRTAEEEIRHLARFPSEDPDPVLRISTDGIVLYANQAGRQILDCWGSGEGGSLPADVHEQVRGVRESGGRTVQDIELDGSVYSFVVAPVPGEDYVNLYGRDVTEHRALEEQLRQTQKMEAIGELAGGIAHDFNNLLQGILGYANLLKLRSSENEETFKAASVIERAGERAAELTRQLLGFARKGKLRDTPVDVHRVISESVAILTRMIDKRIAMIQRLKAEPCVVKGDPGQLQQVVMNLAVNARDAMPEGGELVFDTRVVDLDEESRHAPPGVGPGRYVRLSVSDTGVGMSPEVRGRVFDPFYTTKPKGEGTGMGLAMVYGIVSNHGGTVSVRSDLGKGTTFEVYLPLAGEGARASDSQELKAVARGSGRVLVVDDEETVRDILAEMLKALGYEVRCVGDGREAVEHYREHAGEIDLVVLDMTMPVMDGLRCFEEIKKIDPGVKAILATGHALDGAAQGLMDQGVLRAIQKPFVMHELAETVAKALRSPV